MISLLYHFLKKDMYAKIAILPDGRNTPPTVAAIRCRFMRHKAGGLSPDRQAHPHRTSFVHRHFVEMEGIEAPTHEHIEGEYEDDFTSEQISLADDFAEVDNSSFD